MNGKQLAKLAVDYATSHDSPITRWGDLVPVLMDFYNQCEKSKLSQPIITNPIKVVTTCDDSKSLLNVFHDVQNAKSVRIDVTDGNCYISILGAKEKDKVNAEPIKTESSREQIKYEFEKGI